MDRNHIVVLTIETDEPAWNKLFWGYASARSWLAEWCKENWEAKLGDVPEDPHTICKTYFERDSGDLSFHEMADIKVYDLATLKEVPFEEIPKAVLEA